MTRVRWLRVAVWGAVAVLVAIAEVHPWLKGIAVGVAVFVLWRRIKVRFGISSLRGMFRGSRVDY